MNTPFFRWVVAGCYGLLNLALHGADIYVSPSGAYSAPGTDVAPTTIQRGVSIAQAGDTVWLKPGTYPILTATDIIKPLNSGTSTAPITIRSVSGGADAILDGQWITPNPATTYTPPANWHGLIDLIDKSWIVVDGIKVINSGFFGIYIGSVSGTASNITIKNCVTYHTYGSGIAARRASNIKVLSNVVQRACQYPDGAVSSGECISMITVDGFEVAYNTISDRLSDLNNGGEGIDAKDGSKNGTIHGNLTYDLVDLGIYTDAWDETNENIGIYGNVVQNCLKGIAIGAETSQGIIRTVTVRDNLIKDVPTRGICISNWNSLNTTSTCNGVIQDIGIYNNTIVNCATDRSSAANMAIYIAALNPANSGFVVNNNILSSNGGAIGAQGQSCLTVDRNLIYQSGSSSVTMTNTLVSNPLFVDTSNGNYRLLATSPAIDCALGTWVSGLDILGVVRPVNGVADLGAYEYNGSTMAAGLKADYYSGTGLTGASVGSREEAVMLALGDRSPMAGIVAGNFSVRWTGSIEPTANGTYSFRLRTNNGLRRSSDNVLNVNGARLWLNNELLVDAWDGASPNSVVSGGRMLYAGQRYPIKVEFKSAAGNAAVFLEWMKTTSTFESIPLERLYSTSWQEYWRQVYFGTTANTGEAADLSDPDADGLANLLEYALYLDPKKSQTTGLPVVALSNGKLQLTFYRRRAELTYLVQGSDDLTNWTTIATNPGTPGNSVTVADTNTTSPNRFLRLRVTNSLSGVVTIPEGRVTLTLSQTVGTTPPNQDCAVSFPLNDVIGTVTGKHTGTITSIGTDTLANNTAGWAAGQFSQVATPYWVRITSGAAAGRLFLVSTTTANTSTQLTLNTEGANLTTLGIVAGTDTYELFPADTLSTLFPPGLIQTGANASGDLLKLWNGTTWLCYYHNGTQWYCSGVGVADNTVVRPDQGWHITRRGPTVSLVLLGRAPTTRGLAAVNRGQLTYLSLLPVPNTLLQLSLQTLPGWTNVPSNPTAGDHVKQWNGSGWRLFYHDGTQWQEQGVGPANGYILTQPGRPFMIVRPTGTGIDWVSQAKTY